MRFPHDLGREARQHLVRCVSCRNKKTYPIRITSPFVDAAFGGSHTEFRCGTGGHLSVCRKESLDNFLELSIVGQPREH